MQIPEQTTIRNSFKVLLKFFISYFVFDFINDSYDVVEPKLEKWQPIP